MAEDGTRARVAELLAAFEEEVVRTRLMLELVPAARLDWRPHPKSRTAGELALHLARIPGWAGTLLAGDGYDLAGDAGPSTSPNPDPASNEERLALFDTNVARARTALAACPAARLDQPWVLHRGGQVRRRMTRGTALRVFLLDHLIHHRAQLGVYLRLLDVPVPALYGSSADESA